MLRYISLHGVKGIRLLINLDHVKTFQEITNDSKYAEYLASNAKTMIHLDDKVLPVQESIIQVKNILNKLNDSIGGTEA